LIVNPGGIVAPENVIGRDEFIRRLWRSLERQGVILVAERRMGKTTIINKMKAEPIPGVLLFCHDVEGISRASEFVEFLAREIWNYLSSSKKAKIRFKKLWSALGGTEIGGLFKLPPAGTSDWKVLLIQIVNDLVQEQENKVVLILDEFPWMLQKIGKKEGQATVADLIDTLRALRGQHPTLRMVFTGSIGLHHVVSGLRRDGYSNSPINDMDIVEVPPLDQANAQLLASALLHGADLATSQEDETVDLIVKLVDGVPYYIHHVVAGLVNRGGPATSEAVESVVGAALTGAHDPWQLEHYRSRLANYYDERAGLVRAILNVLANHGPLALDDLLEKVKLIFSGDNDHSRRIVAQDREAFRGLVKLMLRDHYLSRDDQGSYDFRFGLIRRWWRLEM
jgi:hypothetical protein